MSDADNIQRELETSESEDDWTERFPRPPGLFSQRDYYGNRIGQLTENSIHQLDRLGLPMANILPEIQTGVAIDTRPNDEKRKRLSHQRRSQKQQRSNRRAYPKQQSDVETTGILGLDGMQQGTANDGVTINSDSISNRSGASGRGARPGGNSFGGRLQRTQGKLKCSS